MEDEGRTEELRRWESGADWLGDGGASRGRSVLEVAAARRQKVRRLASQTPPSCNGEPPRQRSGGEKTSAVRSAVMQE